MFFVIKMITLSGPFSRSAVNYNAGCKTAASNIVMSIAVMLTLLFLTPLFYYTPLVVLAAIIVSAMLGLIDYEAAIHLWKIDKFDFFVCISAYMGVVFGSVEIGLVIAVCINSLFVLPLLSLVYKFMKLMCFLMFRLQYQCFGYYYLLQGQGHLFWETFQIL
jgi:sulfate transporter 3